MIHWVAYFLVSLYAVTSSVSSAAIGLTRSPEHGDAIDRGGFPQVDATQDFLDWGIPPHDVVESNKLLASGINRLATDPRNNIVPEDIVGGFPGEDDVNTYGLANEKRAFSPWSGKRVFSPWAGKRPFSPWGGKRAFNPWGGKRQYKRPFSPWGGKRSSKSGETDIETGIAESEKRAFNPWGGKRAFNPWGGKRGSFSPWGGKRNDDAVTDDTEEMNKRQFRPWAGKRAMFNPWGGKRSADDADDEPVYNAWASERAQLMRNMLN